eukprot:658037-Amphidinium_carterae.1
MLASTHAGKINYHALKGRPCVPLKRKKRMKLDFQGASVHSAPGGAEPLPAGVGEYFSALADQVSCSGTLVTSRL